jgi:hypothetical protein
LRCGAALELFDQEVPLLPQRRGDARVEVLARLFELDGERLGHVPGGRGRGELRLVVEDHVGDGDAGEAFGGRDVWVARRNRARGRRGLRSRRGRGRRRGCGRGRSRGLRRSGGRLLRDAGGGLRTDAEPLEDSTETRGQIGSHQHGVGIVTVGRALGGNGDAHALHARAVSGTAHDLRDHRRAQGREAGAEHREPRRLAEDREQRIRAVVDDVGRDAPVTEQLDHPLRELGVGLDDERVRHRRLRLRRRRARGRCGGRRGRGHRRTRLGRGRRAALGRLHPEDRLAGAAADARALRADLLPRQAEAGLTLRASGDQARLLGAQLIGNACGPLYALAASARSTSTTNAW